MSERCQRWNGGRHSWRHPSDGGFDQRRYTVEPIPESVARPFVTGHHYAGTYPAGRLAFGLHTDGTLVGVAVLSVPMRADVLTNVFPDLEPYEQTLELGRFVLTDETPANAESWFLARTFEQAADAGLRGVVSFSDPMPRRREVTDLDEDGRTVTRVETVTPGHVGLIYQATNAHACGRSTARTLTTLPRHGVVLSDRLLSKVRGQEQGADYAERHLVALGAPVRRAGEDPRLWLRRALIALDATKVRHPGNYRYAWAVGSPAARRRTRIALPRTAYPKPSTGRTPAPSLDEQPALIGVPA